MSLRTRQFLLVYGLPFLTVATAVALTIALIRLTNENRTLSLFFFGAIMLSASYGGKISGLLATAVSLLGLGLFLREPFTDYSLSNSDIPLLVVFSFLAIVMTYLVDFHRRSEMQRTGSNVRLTVADTGEGIDSDLLPHIFERFRQGRTGGYPHSLGLGLSIVRDVIEAHGGTVEAASNGRGKGTSFVITLPCHEAAELEERVIRKAFTA